MAPGLRKASRGDRPGAPKSRWVKGTSAWKTYLRTLNELGYEGPLTIEREIPQEPERQKAEIGHAVNLLEELKAKLL